jgi:creatinine deaminase
VDDATAYAAALASARQGMAEGGIPIGASLMVDGEIISVGRNMRVQLDSAIHHGETNCIERAGRQPATVYARSTIFTTLSPCFMCAGTILLYKIPRVVIGENDNFQASEDLLRSHDVEVVVLHDAETKTMFKNWIEVNPRLWNEDIGEED